MSMRFEIDACVSDLKFDRYFAEELPESELNALSLHLANCARCGVRIQVLSTQREAFLERVPSWDRLAKRSTRREPAVRRAPLWAGSLAFALAALIALWSQLELAGTRSKGHPRIGVILKRGQQLKHLQSQDLVRPGDQLRFVYNSLAETEFALLHRDAGRASIWYPLTTQTARLAAGRDVPLDLGIELDDSAGDEQLYGLFCSRTVQLAPLVATLEQTGRLGAPPDCQIETIVLRKRSAE